MSGNHDNSRIYTHIDEFVEYFHSVHARHLYITEYDVVFLFLGHRTALCSILCNINIITLV